MNEALLDSVASRWARLGVMLNVKAAQDTPDVERLLLDTARVASANSRLLVLAASWLALHGKYVAPRRLAGLIRNELEVDHRPTLGLLLELANQHERSNRYRFDLAIQACGSAIDGRPLSDVELRNSLYRRLAEDRASALSRKWGRWVMEIELKGNALRPPKWITEQNPSLADGPRHG